MEDFRWVLSNGSAWSVFCGSVVDKKGEHSYTLDFHTGGTF